MSGTETVTIEKRRRGPIGRIVAFLFWIWQLIMAAWLISYWVSIGNVVQNQTSEAERTGAAIGGTLGTGMVLTFWLIGSVILGLMMLFTRGHKIIITKTK